MTNFYNLKLPPSRGVAWGRGGGKWSDRPGSRLEAAANWTVKLPFQKQT